MRKIENLMWERFLCVFIKGEFSIFDAEPKGYFDLSKGGFLKF